MFTDKEDVVVNESKESPKIHIEGLDIEVDEDLFNEKDDNLESTPEEEPETGQSSNQGELPEGFATKYKDKSNEELLKTLYESQKQIGKLGNELGSRRKQQEDPMTSLKNSRSEVEKELAKLEDRFKDEYDDEYDSDEEGYKKLKTQIDRKKAKLSELQSREKELNIEALIDKKVNADHNKDFLEKSKKELAENLGMDTIPEDIWDEIEDGAKRLAGTGGKISNEDIHASTIKTLGYDSYIRIVQSMAKSNVRQDIANATKKTVFDVSSKGAASKKLEDMTDSEVDKVLAHLYNNDYDKFLKLKERIEMQ